LEAKKTDSPLWKSIFALRDRLINLCGGVALVQQLLSNWQSGSSPFTANAWLFQI
jgi:hypothetical protein